MPSSILFNGKRVYKPGVYGYVDASSLGGKGISTGNMAIVGAFPTFEALEPQTFSNPKALAEYDPTDLELARLAKLAFSPSLDEAVPGGADHLTIVNAQPCTAASITYNDSGGAGSLKLTSKLWGTKGNQVWTQLKTNASNNKAVDLTVVHNGQTETYTAIQSGNIAEVYYDGADLTACTLAVSTSWTWLWTKEFAAYAGAPVVFTPTAMVVCSKIAAALSVAAPVGGVTVALEGIDTTGVPRTETITFVEGASGPIDSTYTYARLDELTWTAPGAYVGKLTIRGTAFALTASEYDSVGAILDFINNNASKGFHAVAKSPKAGSLAPSNIDQFTAADCFAKAPATAKALLRADLWALLEALSSSNLVVASKASGATHAPKQFGAAPAVTEDFYLIGGTVSAVADADFDNALAAIVAEDVQIVVLLDATLARIQKLATHCIDAARLGYERCAWAGASSNQSLTNLFDNFTSQLNTRHVALVADDVEVEGPTGALEWLEPKYFAVMCAGMQAGTPVATPLTNKRPSIVDARHDWTTVVEDDEVIAKGICGLTRDNLGWKILRSVTTYLTDDNPVLSEVSANESVNTSLRRLRAALVGKIGTTTAGLTPGRFAGLVKAELDGQVADTTIKAWRNVNITDLGDAYRVDYDVAAAEPLNFIPVFAHVVRISGT